jgi:hypothetical protein
VVGIGPGVDDVANRLRRDPLDRRDDGRSAGGRARVHHDDAVVADLHGDIAAGAGDHEEVGTYLQHFQAIRRRGARDLRCRECPLDRIALDDADSGAHGDGEQTATGASGSWEHHGSLAREG